MQMMSETAAWGVVRVCRGTLGARTGEMTQSGRQQAQELALRQIEQCDENVAEVASELLLFGETGEVPAAGGPAKKALHVRLGEPHVLLIDALELNLAARETRWRRNWWHRADSV